jgi:hypothetical protein
MAEKNRVTFASEAEAEKARGIGGRRIAGGRHYQGPR